MLLKLKKNLLNLLFYINYEECKFLFQMLFLNSHYSFILTMRNVNFIFNLMLYSSCCSFILTMRNVNAKRLGDESGAFYVLY